MLGKKALILFLGLATYHRVGAFTTPYYNSFTMFHQKTKVGPLEAANTQSCPEDEQSISFESAVRNGWKPDRGHFIGLRRKSSSTKREMAGDGAVMPDGGLSPCIIKVVGVGGGGCNAVSTVGTSYAGNIYANL